MESVALFTPAQRRELFFETAARKRMTPSIVEKDFWVCWTLGRLFANSTLSRLLMFKGGTSLSKVFNLIHRFSEDIDLVLDWRVVVGQENPMGQRSASKQAILNQAMNDNARVRTSRIVKNNTERRCMGCPLRRARVRRYATVKHRHE